MVIRRRAIGYRDYMDELMYCWYLAWDKSVRVAARRNTTCLAFVTNVSNTVKKSMFRQVGRNSTEKEREGQGEQLRTRCNAIVCPSSIDQRTPTGIDDVRTDRSPLSITQAGGHRVLHDREPSGTYAQMAFFSRACGCEICKMASS